MINTPPVSTKPGQAPSQNPRVCLAFFVPTRERSDRRGARKGNVLVLAAMDWECAWVREYLWAVDADDSERAAAATRYVSKFPDLDVIQEHNPELGEGYRDTLIAEVAAGGTAFVEGGLNSNCGVGS